MAPALPKPRKSDKNAANNPVNCRKVIRSTANFERRPRDTIRHGLSMPRSVSQLNNSRAIARVRS